MAAGREAYGELKSARARRTADTARTGGDVAMRPRQNVVFELGFFIGVLGPERVVALVKGKIERPSDFDGVVYIPFDEHSGWKVALVRELEAAGFEVNP
jgi:predicted nucleotide-binding protein